MIGFQKAAWVFGSLVVIGLIAGTAPAGLLGTGLSYNDGSQIWEGTRSFSKAVTGGTLSGSLDYAVFAPEEFNSLFTGYGTTAGELVYAYQIHNTGSVNITLSKLLLLSGAPADAAGIFQGNGVSGQDPFESYITPGINVTWDFTNGHNIVSPGDSVGLAFCSIRKPMGRDVDVIVDGGGSVNVTSVAGPGLVNVPEPAGLALLTVIAVAAGIAGARSRWKERQNEIGSDN
jgi:hypothetical protein